MPDLASPPAPSGGPTTPPRSRKWWYIGGVCVLALALVGFGIWYFVFRDDSPPAVNIERATESLDTKGSGNGQSTSSLDGTWKVDPSIGSFTDFTNSFVGYRVQEELAGIGAKTAVGRTPDVSGSITIDGTTIPKADFTADLSTLKSDEGRRDGAIHSQGLETSRFPTATFELTEPIDLGKIPAEGTKTSVDATGTLTLHGVSKDVTIPLDAVQTGDTIAVTGQVGIPFADYGIQKPVSFQVLSIENRGILEVQLFFTKST
jgi:polyisoprenoid-binding protein YceI